MSSSPPPFFSLFLSFFVFVLSSLPPPLFPLWVGFCTTPFKALCFFVLSSLPPLFWLFPPFVLSSFPPFVLSSFPPFVLSSFPPHSFPPQFLLLSGTWWWFLHNFCFRRFLWKNSFFFSPRSAGLPSGPCLLMLTVGAVLTAVASLTGWMALVSWVWFGVDVPCGFSLVW